MLALSLAERPVHGPAAQRANRSNTKSPEFSYRERRRPASAIRVIELKWEQRHVIQRFRLDETSQRLHAVAIESISTKRVLIRHALQGAITRRDQQNKLNHPYNHARCERG